MLIWLSNVNQKYQSALLLSICLIGRARGPLCELTDVRGRLGAVGSFWLCAAYLRAETVP